jgi:Lrp/AsnC ligand binding domain
MLEAYILIESHLGKAAIVAAQVRAVPGVSETEILTGPYDVVARAQALDMDELAKRTSQIQALPGVMRTATCTKPSFSLSGRRSRGQPTSPWRTRWNRHHRRDTNGPLARERWQHADWPYTPDPSSQKLLTGKVAGRR